MNRNLLTRFHYAIYPHYARVAHFQSTRMQQFELHSLSGPLLLVLVGHSILIWLSIYHIILYVLHQIWHPVLCYLIHLSIKKTKHLYFALWSQAFVLWEHKLPWIVGNATNIDTHSSSLYVNYFEIFALPWILKQCARIVWCHTVCNLVVYDIHMHISVKHEMWCQIKLFVIHICISA